MLSRDLNRIMIVQHIRDNGNFTVKNTFTGLFTFSSIYSSVKVLFILCSANKLIVNNLPIRVLIKRRHDNVRVLTSGHLY
jgi:hypothetical protein